MIVYYENVNGEKLNLLKAPFRTTKTDWFDADWSESSEGYEKTVTLDVFGKRGISERSGTIISDHCG